MIWHVKAGTGIRAVQFVEVVGEDEPDAVVTFEVQGGAVMHVTMRPSEWRWLAIDLYQKKKAEDQRMGLE